MPVDLSVPQLFETITSLGRAASVRSQEDIERVEGVFVGFALALDELVEIRVRCDMAELERHCRRLLAILAVRATKSKS